MIEMIITFAIGTIFGSFFYTLALRYINDSIKISPINALTSRSHCTNCKKLVPIIGLIPIIGYLIYKGKCKYCNSKISIKYPLAEILFGILLLFITKEFGYNLYSINLFLLASISITITIIDIKRMIIPNSLLIVLLLFSIYPIILSEDIFLNLYGAIFLFTFFLIILLIFPGSFGFGDIKYATLIGFLVGLEQSIIVLESSLIIGSIIGVIYAIKNKKKLMSKIAFGPFLTIGGFVSFIWGREIIVLYFKIIN